MCSVTIAVIVELTVFDKILVILCVYTFLDNSYPTVIVFIIICIWLLCKPSSSLSPCFPSPNPPSPRSCSKDRALTTLTCSASIIEVPLMSSSYKANCRALRSSNSSSPQLILKVWKPTDYNHTLMSPLIVSTSTLLLKPLQAFTLQLFKSTTTKCSGSM